MVVLGPVPCQGCRQGVTWDGREWQSGSKRHECGGELRGIVNSSQTARGPAIYDSGASHSNQSGHIIPAVASIHKLYSQPSRPSARRAAGVTERRSTASPRPRETRPVAARQPGAEDYGVKADLGPSSECAERTPRRTADASSPPPGNGGRVPHYRSATAPHRSGRSR